MINVSNEHLDEKQWEFIVEFVNKKSENLEEVPTTVKGPLIQLMKTCVKVQPSKFSEEQIQSTLKL